MTSPDTNKRTQVAIRAIIGKENSLIWGSVHYVADGLDWLPQSFFAEVDQPEEVSAFYDDMTHAVRQGARDICEAVFDLCHFQPSLPL